MKPFSTWFNDSRGQHDIREHWETPAPVFIPTAAPEYDPLAEGDLTEGLDERGRPVYFATCSRCERKYEWLGDSPQDFTEEYNLCGGSPRCCP